MVAALSTRDIDLELAGDIQPASARRLVRDDSTKSKNSITLLLLRQGLRSSTERVSCFFDMDLLFENVSLLLLLAHTAKGIGIQCHRLL
jgi:hypothetical protein